MRYIIVMAFLLLFSTSCFAASDAARVEGDLKVGGIHFAGDSSTMNSSKGLVYDKGAWSASANYNAGEMVQSAGSSYVCTTANTNVLPPNASYWSVLAAQGSQGFITGSELVFCEHQYVCNCGAGKVLKAVVAIKCGDGMFLSNSRMSSLSAIGWDANCLQFVTIPGIPPDYHASYRFDMVPPNEIAIACTTP